MCQPVKNYLGVIREYTREIITFGGFGLCFFIYADFRAVAQLQAETAARTVEVLRQLEARASSLEQYHAREEEKLNVIIAKP